MGAYSWRTVTVHPEIITAIIASTEAKNNSCNSATLSSSLIILPLSVSLLNQVAVDVDITQPHLRQITSVLA